MQERKQDGNLADRERSVVKSTCGVQLNDKKSERNDSDVGFQSNNRPLGYSKYLVLAWSCVEEGIGV